MVQRVPYDARVRGTVFVGRHQQLAALDAAVRDAAAGVPRVIVIGGPAGMGKTHLISHFADRLGERGTLTLQTSCVELGAAGVPLVPVTTSVRQLADRLDDMETAATVPALRSLEQLLPEHRIDGGRVEAAAMADLFAAVLHRLGTRRLVVQGG